MVSVFPNYPVKMDKRWIMKKHLLCRVIYFISSSFKNKKARFLQPSKIICQNCNFSQPSLYFSTK